MAIKIIDEPDILLTREQYEGWRRQWEAAMSMNACPVSFEVWLARKLNYTAKGEPKWQKKPVG
jgi:hypothetical protein